MRWISAVGGAIVTAAAVAVIASATSAPSPSGAAPSLAAPLAPPPPLIVEQPSTTTTVAADPVVTGLDPSVSEALTTLGYTDFVSESDLRGQLPKSVVDALIDDAAVLVVPDTPEAP